VGSQNDNGGDWSPDGGSSDDLHDLTAERGSIKIKKKKKKKKVTTQNVVIYINKLHDIIQSTKWVDIHGITCTLHVALA